VAAGKSTLAAALQHALVERGIDSTVLCTDCFLHPNAALDAGGLSMRKGFPESFDTEALAQCLRALRGGGGGVRVPVYSHQTYDIVAGSHAEVARGDVVIVEGVNVFWSPVVDALDIGIYIDAEDADLRQWFLTRFDALCEAARDDPQSFYRPLAGMPEADRRSLADAAWSAINLVNLHTHIAPSRARAHYVVRKAADHTWASVSAGPMRSTKLSQ